MSGYPTLLFIKNEKVYRFKGPRDETTLKDFILRNYKSYPTSDIPDGLPSFWESLKNGFSDFTGEIIAIYKSGNTTAIAILSFLFGLVFVLVAAIFYFLFCDKPQKYDPKRSSYRQSSSSIKKDSQTLNSSGEGLKKRSTRRRESDD